MLTCHSVICFSAATKVTWTLGRCLFKKGLLPQQWAEEKNILPLEMLQNANVNLFIFATVLTSKSWTEGFFYENRMVVSDGSWLRMKLVH